MSMRASTGFCAVIGIVRLSVHSVPPSSGMTNFRLLPSSALTWKMSPDQAMVIQMSPLVSGWM